MFQSHEMWLLMTSRGLLPYLIKTYSCVVRALRVQESILLFLFGSIFYIFISTPPLCISDLRFINAHSTVNITHSIIFVVLFIILSLGSLLKHT